MTINIRLIVLLQLLIVCPWGITVEQQRAREEQWFKNNPHSLPHWMTLEEQTRINEIGLNFVPTPPLKAPIRQTAEFEVMSGVLIRYPLGIPLDLVVEMSQDVHVYCLVTTGQQSTAQSQFSNAGAVMNNVSFVNSNTDSYWTRDYGPWWVFDGENNPAIVNFTYNRPRPNDDGVPEIIAGTFSVPFSNMPLTTVGGNFMTDGYHIGASTDVVKAENQNLQESDIATRMNDYTGMENYHIVADPTDKYIQHIDTWAKFLTPNVILFIEVPMGHLQYSEVEASVAYWREQTTSYGEHYKIFRVSTPNDEPYTNSLILNNKVLVPIMGNQWDEEAIQSYEEAMPGYQVMGFLSGGEPWLSTDALHCRARGIPDFNMLYIKHNPLPDSVPNGEFFIEAEFIAYSGGGLKEDSLLVFFKSTLQSDFQSVLMIKEGSGYKGVIPLQSELSTVQYYIQGVDSTGKKASLPIVGPAGPFQFVVQPALDNKTNPADANSNFYFSVGSKTLSFKLKDPQKIKILRLNGALIRSLPADNLRWSGWDDKGQKVTPGIYFVQVISRFESVSKKFYFNEN